MSRYDDRSEDAKAYRRLYNSARWRKARLIFLSHYLICRFCEAQGHITEARVVDHVRPHRGDLDLFWDEENWQALCKPCHDATKGQMERGGYSAMSDLNGYPIDPNHPINVQDRKRLEPRAQTCPSDASGRQPRLLVRPA